MEELKKQLDNLIYKTEEKKLHYIITGQKSLADIYEGHSQAYKLIIYLIDTNLKFYIDKSFSYDNI